MKKMLILVCSFLLFSCTNDNNTGNSCSKNISSDTTFSANSLQVFVATGEQYTPLEGVAVQIDHNGSCLMTDEKGFVRFDGLNSYKHDVHVFGKPGYEWRSQYQLETTMGEVISVSIEKIASQPDSDTKNHSYINIKGNITNSADDSRIRVSYRSNFGRSYRGGFQQISPTNTTYERSDEFEQPVGTSIDSEFWVTEESTNIMGDGVLVDAFKVAKFTSVSTSKTGTAVVKDITFQPLQAKPQLSRLITFGNINYPVGLSFSGIFISGSFPSSNIPNSYFSIELFSRISYPGQPKALTSSTIIESYTSPFNFESLGLFLNATSGELYEKNWDYSTNRYAVGVTGVTIIPKITNVPSIMFNKKGDTISWNSNSSAYNGLRLDIREQFNDLPIRWRFRLAGNLTQITLPKIPSSVKPLLLIGTGYRVSLMGSYYTQDTTNNLIYENESFSTFQQWIR